MLDADNPVWKDTVEVRTVAAARPPMEIAALPAVLPAVLRIQDVQQILPGTARHARRKRVEKDCLLVILLPRQVADVEERIQTAEDGADSVNRSVQAEGAFGGIKWNRSYTRARKRGLDGMLLETALISCGFNLHKFHLKSLAKQLAA